MNRYLSILSLAAVFFLLSGCNLIADQALPIEIPDVVVESPVATPLSTLSVVQFGDEEHGPEMQLVDPPAWLELADASGRAVEKCPVYEGCTLKIGASAPAGEHDVTIQFTFQNSISVNINITININPIIIIEPESVELLPEEQQQFRADVLGGENDEVEWSADCGSISETGLYTAPSRPEECAVVAASVAYEDLRAEARVIVKPNNALVVDVTPDNAWVTVTGPEEYRASFQGDRTLSTLPPGEYTVSASLDGYFPDSTTVQVGASGTTTAMIVLEPMPNFDFVPELILTNEDEGATETTVPEGTVVTVLWGMAVSPNTQEALAEARSKVEDPGVVVLLLWKKAGSEEFERLARIYQMPGDELREYPLPAAGAGENVIRVVVDPEDQVLEADDQNNQREWIVWGEAGEPTNALPTVSLSASPTSGQAPLTVSFSADAYDSDGSIVSYEWDFDGDGVYDRTSTESRETYTYQEACTCYATVRVTDDQRAQATDRLRIVVTSEQTDGNPPTVEWLRPNDGDTVTGPVTLKVAVDGDEPISVAYFANDELLVSGVDYPYEYTWTPTSADNGSVALKAVATDPDGDSDPVTIAVAVQVMDRELWRLDLTSYGTPKSDLVVHEGYAYTVTDFGYVVALNVDGNLWSSESANNALNTSPTFVGDALYVHAPNGWVYKYSLNSGAHEWYTAETPGIDFGSGYSSPRLPAPPVYDSNRNLLWVAGSSDPSDDNQPNNCVHAVDPGSGAALATECFGSYIEGLMASDDGRLLVAEEVGLTSMQLHLLSLSNQEISVESSPTFDGKLDDGVALLLNNDEYYVPSQTGEIFKGTLSQITSDPDALNTGMSHRSGLVMLPGGGFAVNYGGDLCVLDSTGATQWCQDVGMYFRAMPVYNAERGELYGVSADGEVWAMDLQGNVRFRYLLGGSGTVLLSPATLSDRLIVIRNRTALAVDLRQQ